MSSWRHWLGEFLEYAQGYVMAWFVILVCWGLLGYWQGYVTAWLILLVSWRWLR